MPNTAIKTSQIQDDAVTFAKIENASAESILIGRGTGNGGGNYQAVTLGSGLTMSGTTLSASGGVSDGNKGDISVSGSGTTWTIGSSKITDIKIANNTITDNKIAYDTITDSRISSSAGISISKLASQSYSKLIGTSSSSNTVTAITLGSGLTMTGSTLSAQAGGVSYSAFKAADETINTMNTYYSNDTDLQVSMDVEGWYSIELGIVSTCTANAFLGIDNVLGYAKISHMTQAGYDVYNNGPNVGNVSAGTNNFTKISGIVYSSSYTIVKFCYYRQFGGNVTIHAGSYLKVVKIN